MTQGHRRNYTTLTDVTRMHGGLAPFGYEYKDGDLHIVEAEAEIVRGIFALFLHHQTYTAVMNLVQEAGLRSSVKELRNGSQRGGRLISAGMVHSIIGNPIYVGEIRGHDKNYEGRHTPIIDRETWEKACVIAQTRKRKPPDSLGTPHFLAGLLWDDLGRHMLLDLSWVDGDPFHSYISSNAQWSRAEYRRPYRTRADRLDA